MDKAFLMVEEAILVKRQSEPVLQLTQSTMETLSRNWWVIGNQLEQIIHGKSTNKIEELKHISQNFDTFGHDTIQAVETLVIAIIDYHNQKQNTHQGTN